MKAIDWSMIAKKAWKTRRKNEGKAVQRKTVKSEKSEKLSEHDKMMARIFGRKTIDEEWESLNREMVRKMRRKTLMERALGIGRESGIFVGKKQEKFKVQRWNGGVKIGA